MPGLFDISDTFAESVEDGFDDILDLLSKPCLLIYPASTTDCVNCIYDPIGKKSSNRWTTGGPMPFNSGACPMCNGQGRIATENSETINMTINWGPITFDKGMPAGIRLPLGGAVETRGYMADYPKVKKCETMRIVSPYGRFVFKLDGEPSDPFQLVQGKYFIANWKRIG